mgnify:CR=1 FL=1
MLLRAFVISSQSIYQELFVLHFHSQNKVISIEKERQLWTLTEQRASIMRWSRLVGQKYKTKV